MNRDIYVSPVIEVFQFTVNHILVLSDPDSPGGSGGNEGGDGPDDNDY